MSNIDLDQLRSSYDLRDYVSPYLGEGIRSTQYTQYCCPFHSDDRPSFTVWADHAHCYGCEWHGTIIDFVMEYDNLSIKEAIEALSRNVPLEPRPARPQQPVEPRKPSIPMSIVEANFRHLDLGLPYYQQRQITDPTAHTSMLGVKTDFPTAYTMTTGEVVWFKAPRYALPNIFNGEVREINYRRDDQHFLDTFLDHPRYFEVIDDLFKKLGRTITNEDILKHCGGPKYRREEGSVARVFNVQMVAEAQEGKILKRSQPFLLIHAEPKEMDTLAMMDAGWPAAGVTLSAELNPMLPKIFEHIPMLYIVRDNDEPGLKKAEKLHQILNRGRIIAPPKEYKDSGEVLQAGMGNAWLTKQFGLEPVLR